MIVAAQFANIPTRLEALSAHSRGLLGTCASRRPLTATLMSRDCASEMTKQSKPSRQFASRGHVKGTATSNRSRETIDSPRQLRRVIEALSSESPLTDAFTQKWRQTGRRRGRGQQERAVVWYNTQHEHWLGWLEGWNGPGAYGRQNWKRSAAFVYAHIVNPQMLVYLAEAAGLPKALVVEAMREALANWESMQSMSAAIRRVVPWPTIEEALLARVRSGRTQKGSRPKTALAAHDHQRLSRVPSII
jgi:hypothetical protein